MNKIILFIIIVNVIFSAQGFKNKSFLDKYLFSEGAILHKKEYYRLITSGFLYHLLIYFSPN